jgi:NADPH-dependent 2,4-dienoyl-CoA reductase/sulfur reductase-like enzyme
MDLKQAGAEVTLIEREGEAGGQLRPASRPPGKEPYAEWVEWAVRRLHSLGMEVELGQEAGIENLREGDWRGVIAATGAKPVIPSLPGTGLDINAEAREVLLGERKTGQVVLVVGSGPVGMETADYLIQEGCRVTVVDELDHSPVMPLTSHGAYLHRVLRKKGELLLNTRVVQVTPGGAIISTRGEERELQVDTVVWAVGSQPELEIIEAARELGLEVKVVGDAVEPRRLLEAVHEGYRAAREFLETAPE